MSDLPLPLDLMSDIPTPLEEPAGESTVEPIEPAVDAVIPPEPEPPKLLTPGLMGYLPDEMDAFQTRPAGPDDPPMPKRAKVVRITSQNDQVVYELADGTRWPVQWHKAMKRAEAVMDAMLREDGSKPQDELERECWLLEGVVKAAADCRRQMGRPFQQKAVDRCLFQINYLKNRIRTINLSQGICN